MIAVPLAGSPEVPGAVIPHAGICVGGHRATDVPTLIGNQMGLPQKRSQRMAALIMIGLFFGCIVVAGVTAYLVYRKPPKIPIEQALWVTAWEIQRIYAPGTPEQRSIVAQLGEELEFDSPVLYRMGGSSAAGPSEGLILFGFNPSHPEMAQAMKQRKRNEADMSKPEKPSD